MHRALAQVGTGGGGPVDAATLSDLSAQFSNLEAELTTLWVLLCALFVFQVKAAPAVEESQGLTERTRSHVPPCPRPIPADAIRVCAARGGYRAGQEHQEHP